MPTARLRADGLHSEHKFEHIQVSTIVEMGAGVRGLFMMRAGAWGWFLYGGRGLRVVPTWWEGQGPVWGPPAPQTNRQT